MEKPNLFKKCIKKRHATLVVMITEQEIIDATKINSNKKTPDNDGETKVFYERFWNKPKEPFMNFLNHTKLAKS